MTTKVYHPPPELPLSLPQSQRDLQTMLPPNSGIPASSNGHTTSQTQQTPRTSDHHISDKNGISTIISASNCLRTKRPRGSGDASLRIRTRPAKSTTISKTYKNKHQHWKSIWNCTTALPAHVWTKEPSTPRYACITMEPGIVVRYYMTISTQYTGQDHRI